MKKYDTVIANHLQLNANVLDVEVLWGVDVLRPTSRIGTSGMRVCGRCCKAWLRKRRERLVVAVRDPMKYRLLQIICYCNVDGSVGSVKHF